jgi:hypothetical protein
MEKEIKINGNNFTSMSLAIDYVKKLFQTKGNDSEFSIGDKIVIYKNSERSPQYARIGYVGSVDGFVSKDVSIVLDKTGEIVRIIEDDLMKLEY